MVYPSSYALVSTSKRPEDQDILSPILFPGRVDFLFESLPVRG